MKYVVQSGIIAGISFVSEVLHELLPLPVPASVYGLVLLLVLLLTGLVKEEQIRESADFLISIMPLFFVPASVALLNSVGLMQGSIVKLFVMCLLSTVTVIAVTGCVTQLLLRVGKKKDGKEPEHE